LNTGETSGKYLFFVSSQEPVTFCFAVHHVTQPTVNLQTIMCRYQRY